MDKMAVAKDGNISPVSLTTDYFFNRHSIIFLRTYTFNMQKLFICYYTKTEIIYLSKMKICIWKE